MVGFWLSYLFYMYVVPEHSALRARALPGQRHESAQGGVTAMRHSLRKYPAIRGASGTTLHSDTHHPPDTHALSLLAPFTSGLWVRRPGVKLSLCHDIAMILPAPTFVSSSMKRGL